MPWEGSRWWLELEQEDANRDVHSLEEMFFLAFCSDLELEILGVAVNTTKPGGLCHPSCLSLMPVLGQCPLSWAAWPLSRVLLMAGVDRWCPLYPADSRTEPPSSHAFVWESKIL